MRAEFKAKYNRELEPPKTWDELIEVAKFFTGKEIDGKKVYGSYIFTERGSEGITMGVTNAMYNYGFDYDGPQEALPYGGLRQLRRRPRRAWMSTRSSSSAASQPGLTNAYMSGRS